MLVLLLVGLEIDGDVDRALLILLVVCRSPLRLPHEASFLNPDLAMEVAGEIWA